MGYEDANGNWIEEFKSIPYKTEQEAKDKIKAVYQLHVVEGGWELNGEPKIEKIGDEFVAVIPLKKPAELNTGHHCR